MAQKCNVAVTEEQQTNTDTYQNLQTTVTGNFRSAEKELKARITQAPTHISIMYKEKNTLLKR